MAQTERFRQQQRVPLAGSERRALERAPAETATQTKDEQATVTVVLRPKTALDPGSLATGNRLSREQFAAQYGADPKALELVQAFAAEFGLTLDQAAPGPSTVYLKGSLGALEEAFGVTLDRHRIGEQTYRVRSGSILLPEQLSGQVLAVLGLDDRPQAAPHFRRARTHAASVSYTPVQVAELYGFPAGATAAGQTIGLIELGGGFQQADITAYFTGLGLPVPNVIASSVDGGTNTPGSADGADGEVMLDIEVSAAVAPGAKIVVYFAPNTDQGFIDAVSAAVHDTTNRPSVVSISWGGPESTWTAQATTSLDAACQAAAAVGVTITVAAGDNGSTDGVTGTANHVDFPASSPHVLACGGTKLEGSGSAIKSEVVWNELTAQEGATGGGVSALFPLPTWQANANVPGSGRGVPDVAGDADPATGYQVRVDGQNQVIGGTSAVAPLWAGLIALANQANGRDAGFVNPTLYGAPSAFRDITKGNNGGFTAKPGWDACTGLGSPHGTAIIAALAS